MRGILFALTAVVASGEQCEDTNNGATDRLLSRCEYYTNDNNLNKCGDYDDDDFVAVEMCCVCSEEKARLAKIKGS